MNLLLIFLTEDSTVLDVDTYMNIENKLIIYKNKKLFIIKPCKPRRNF